jgi:hypothetical protein
MNTPSRSLLLMQGGLTNQRRCRFDFRQISGAPPNVVATPAAQL